MLPFDCVLFEQIQRQESDPALAQIDRGGEAKDNITLYSPTQQASVLPGNQPSGGNESTGGREQYEASEQKSDGDASDRVIMDEGLR